MTTVEIVYGVEGDWGLMSGARQLDAHIFKALGLRSPAFLLEMCKTKTNYFLIVWQFGGVPEWLVELQGSWDVFIKLDIVLQTLLSACSHKLNLE